MFLPYSVNRKKNSTQKSRVEDAIVIDAEDTDVVMVLAAYVAQIDSRKLHTLSVLGMNHISNIAGTVGRI